MIPSCCLISPKDFNVNSPECNSGNTIDEYFQTLKGLNVGLQTILFNPFRVLTHLLLSIPEFYSGLFMLNPFRIAH